VCSSDLYDADKPDGDIFDFRYGTKQFLKHQPSGKMGAKPSHVWALYQLANGGERFVVWTWEKAMAHGEKFSDSFNKDKPWASPWLSSDTAQEEMAKKSVLRALLKYAPKSAEGQIEAAVYADGHAIIADKFEEGGNMKLAFNVKQIAPPDPEMQDVMNQINRADKRPGEEAETVPANGGNAGETAHEAAAAPPPPQAGETAPRSAAAPQAAGNGNARKGGRSLFPADEAADLGGGVEPPDFR
jgi:hypothetical protein